MTMTVERAHALAERLHEGQVDQVGAPYLLHLEAVADALAPFGVEAQIIGLLHDSVEDGKATKISLRLFGVPEVCVLGVAGLTRPGPTHPARTSYQNWVEAMGDISRYSDDELVPSDVLSSLGFNPLARTPRTVLGKIADNGHNLRSDRLQKMEDRAASSKARRYVRSLNALMGSLEDRRTGELVLSRVNPGALNLISA